MKDCVWTNKHCLGKRETTKVNGFISESFVVLYASSDYKQFL